MKQLLSRAIPGILLIGLLGSSAWAQGRVATIELKKVFDNYWKTKQALSVINDRKGDMTKELKNMMDDRAKAKEAYDKLEADANEPAVSAEERDRRKRAAAEKFRYLKDQEDMIAKYDRQAQVTLDEQGNRMRENILGEIRSIVSVKAKGAGFSMVLDTAMLVYNNNENDITDEVLKQLNATAPADLPKLDTPKADEKKADEKKADGKKDDQKVLPNAGSLLRPGATEEKKK